MGDIDSSNTRKLECEDFADYLSFIYPHDTNYCYYDFVSMFVAPLQGKLSDRTEPNAKPDLFKRKKQTPEH